jgi:hypothetical protein
MVLEKDTIGVGDRFAHQAKAQLQAFIKLAADGVEAVPVWNKSNREHSFIGSEPQSVYDAAAAAVKALGWEKTWHVDADHIRLDTVDRFIDASDFFTIDVADKIGQAADAKDIERFVMRHPELIGTHNINGVSSPFVLTEAEVQRIASKYLLAAKQAGEIYKHIAHHKAKRAFIP